MPSVGSFASLGVGSFALPGIGSFAPPGVGSFALGDVLLRLGTPVLLREAEIDNVHLTRFLPKANQEVVGFGVTMDEVLRIPLG